MTPDSIKLPLHAPLSPRSMTPPMRTLERFRFRLRFCTQFGKIVTADNDGADSSERNPYYKAVYDAVQASIRAGGPAKVLHACSK